MRFEGRVERSLRAANGGQGIVVSRFGYPLSLTGPRRPMNAILPMVDSIGRRRGLWSSTTWRRLLLFLASRRPTLSVGIYYALGMLG